ncbi:kinetochore Spc7 family protein [Spiroplasma endosymbiont of Megaselia nigra]|uniref:hypothetical protein n=1 Tax=Spiroplasma endosymbiont of Megaselia nigra TaxID=2478537 RepID=UPI000F872FA6|nr:hypothetical protein [Spiroplasma endosymbiont of Megaselia nigra]RUO85929.1 hypothetical protein D9R21_05995 [Spiroplasma endosymbiont of Megaselia nigra]
MKKLLSLLSVLTISETAVPTTIAATPYQKEKNNIENLKRNKRENNNKNVVSHTDPIFGKPRMYYTINPDTFEEIIFWKLNNDLHNFIIKFQDKFYYDAKLNDARIGGGDIRESAETIWNNWPRIYDFWQNTGKRNKIKIVTVSNFGSSLQDIESIELFEENSFIENKYLNNLWNDFDGDLSKEYIDLGIIEDTDDNFILNKLKEKYPKLNISYFEFFDKKYYSFFDKSFSTKFKIKSNNELIYPIQTLNNKFTFITKKWLNKDLPKLIDNENLIKNWKTNFINWQNENNRQINEDLPKYGNDEKGKALKRTWKGNNINELNNKLLSLSHILETIDIKFKSNELYSKVQNLEKDINELKLQINNLNQKISEIKNSLKTNEDLENCTNIGYIVAASTAWIPYIGTLISTISGMAASICTVINV